ncbi:MAG: transposase [Patescibacteria group bacterium]
MATIRKDLLEDGEVYHIFSRSIAEYKIFSIQADYFRILNALQFYQFENMPMKLSEFLEIENIKNKNARTEILKRAINKNNIVDIISYCIMPTHIHFILKQNMKNGISKFMGDLLNSYTRYFNVRHKRKGPLWESEFKNILIRSNSQLFNLTRYIHLNPVTAYFVNRPEEWMFSSYREYIGGIELKICQFEDFFEVDKNEYIKFVGDRIDYQRELSKIKKLLCE